LRDSFAKASAGGATFFKELIFIAKKILLAQSESCPPKPWRRLDES